MSDSAISNSDNPPPRSLEVRRSASSLAKELARRTTGSTLYIMDEPTTGLHFDDIQKLLKVLNKLVDAGNTIIAVEHNIDVIKSADWVIDLGPEGQQRWWRGRRDGHTRRCRKSQRIPHCTLLTQSVVGVIYRTYALRLKVPLIRGI